MFLQRDRRTTRSSRIPGLLGSLIIVFIATPASAWQYPPASTAAEDQANQDRIFREGLIRRLRAEAPSMRPPAFPAQAPGGRSQPVRLQDGPVTGVPPRPEPRTPSPVSPPAAVAPDPGPSLQEQTGRASVAAAESAQQVQGRLARIRQAIEQAIAAHERAPDFDAVSESQRLIHFERLLAEAVRLGERATADEVALRRSFELWKKTSGDAATFFREAEIHFRSKADEEPYPRAKAMYQKTADWYAARAARHELRSRLVVPSDFGEQMQELRAMTAASKELLTWVRNDEYYLGDGAGIEADLAAFLSAFSAVGDVLSGWTEKLVEDMAEPEPGAPAEPGPKPQEMPAAEAEAGAQAGRFTRGGHARPPVHPAVDSRRTIRASFPSGGGGFGFLDHVAGD